MLQLTGNAKDHLLRLRRERGVNERASARLVRKDGTMRLTFVMTPRAGDRLTPTEGIPVYVTPELANTLEHATIDVEEEGDHRVLVLRHRTDRAPVNKATASDTVE